MNDDFLLLLGITGHLPSLSMSKHLGVQTLSTVHYRPLSHMRKVRKVRIRKFLKRETTKGVKLR